MKKNLTEQESVDEATIIPLVTEESEEQESEKPQRKQHQPGRIAAKATIILQTKPAQKLFNNAHGVTEFSKKMAQIWYAAATDDPYADLFLLRIYDAIIQTRRKLEKMKTDYSQMLVNAEDGVRLELGESIQPMEFPLQFRTPYGYMAAYMLADYDKLSRLFISLRHLGLIDGYFKNVLNEATEWVQTVLRKPSEWHCTGITRQDVRENNEKANYAQALMGKLDAQILEGTLRAPNAPLNRSLEKNVGG